MVLHTLQCSVYDQLSADIKRNFIDGPWRSCAITYRQELIASSLIWFSFIVANFFTSMMRNFYTELVHCQSTRKLTEIFHQFFLKITSKFSQIFYKKWQVLELLKNFWFKTNFEAFSLIFLKKFCKKTSTFSSISYKLEKNKLTDLVTF